MDVYLQVLSGILMSFNPLSTVKTYLESLKFISYL